MDKLTIEAIARATVELLTKPKQTVMTSKREQERIENEALQFKKHERYLRKQMREMNK